MKDLECYHGTGKSNYDEIKETGRFTFKSRSNHWLGNGVYFFIDDFDRASMWAKMISKKNNTPPVVLRILLSFSDEELLDLDKLSQLELLDNYVEELKKDLEQKKISLSFKDKHEFHCFFIDSFIRDHSDYKAVCRTLPSTGNTRVGASQFLPVSKQLCVFDSTMIDMNKLDIIES